MIKALIIDDETNNREKIHNLILKNCPDIEIVGEANGVRSGISAIRKKNSKQQCATAQDSFFQIFL